MSMSFNLFKYHINSANLEHGVSVAYFKLIMTMFDLSLIIYNLKISSTSLMWLKFMREVVPIIRKVEGITLSIIFFWANCRFDKRKQSLKLDILSLKSFNNRGKSLCH